MDGAEAAMPRYELHAVGPFGWTPGSLPSVWDAQEVGSPGVYLWVVETDEGYLVYYVGETGRRFSDRLAAHARGYLSGEYRIYEPERFREGTKILIWPGTWQPHTKHLVPVFMTRYVEMAPKVLEFMATLFFFMCPFEAPRRDRRRIEAAIAGALYDQPPPVGGVPGDGDTLRPPERRREPDRCGAQDTSEDQGPAQRADSVAATFRQTTSIR